MTSNFLLLNSYFFVLLFGLAIGSFLNCLIWRLYKKIPLTPFIKGAFDRSHCPKCGKMIAWYDNIPVLSFIMLKGKCRHCKGAISWQYPIVELVTAILFLMAFYRHSVSLETPSVFLFILRDWFLIAVMIVIFVIDLRWYLILDVVTIPAAIIVFVLNLLLGFSWQNLLISGIIGGSFFLIQFVISKGKWIGGGDIRLGFLMGLALGWPNVLTAVFLAYFIGSIFGIGLILLGKKKWESKIPLGTFLAAATIIVMLWGEKILGWYINKFSIFN